MEENINEIISEKTQSYEFKEEPLQLLYITEDGLLEPTEDVINLLTELKNEKLSVLSFNGPLSSGKSYLANSIINKSSSGFRAGEKTSGIWLWGNPISLSNGTKLLILDCQGLNRNDHENISHKMFMLSLLISTCAIYNTQGGLNDSAIKDFVYYTDLANKINYTSDKHSNLNNIDNLREYFPELIFVNNTLSKENIQEAIENNPLCDKFLKLFPKRAYINSSNLQELIEVIQRDITYKAIDNNIIDGDSLFGLIQNYIDFINDGEQLVIHSALENVLLSKAKNASEAVLEKFKDHFNKKIKFPMSTDIIYKTYFELQQKYMLEFCKKVDKILTPTQTGDYIQRLFADMEKELETILENNKDYYDEWFNMEYQNLGKELSKFHLESIDQIKLFILSYTSTFKDCLNKFLTIPNSEFCQNLIKVLSKIFQEFVSSKLTEIGEKINNIYENYSKECNNNIDSLNSNIEKLNEQIDNNKKLLDNQNKEKSEANKNYLELETKLDKLTRELKSKEQEFENNIKIEKQNYQKMESYYNEQIKEKEQIISNLESKVEKLNQNILGSNKDSQGKVNELNRENIKLQSEIERLKKQGGGGKSTMYDEQSMNLQTLFKNIQSTFMGFKESVDKLDKENENVFKTKYLENSTKEIEEKLKYCVNEIRDFCEKQVKSMNDNYEKEIKKVKEKCDELTFELDKQKSEENQHKEKIELAENKLKESAKQISELNEISKSKDNLIKSQGNAIKMFEDKDLKKIKPIKKIKNKEIKDENKNSKNIVDNISFMERNDSSIIDIITQLK